MKRQMMAIDEDLCTGCGLCIPNCPEGALQIIDGKARLISDLFCDGLGACIGHCPEGAISTETRDAVPYDEEKVMENIVRQGPNVISAHLAHLRAHAQDEYFREGLAYLVEHDVDIPEEFLQPSCRCGESENAKPQFPSCPGSRIMNLEQDASPAASMMPRSGSASPGGETARPLSRLRQWPVQIMLVPPHAPFLKGADLLIAADCVPFAYAGFHERLLDGKVLLVGCPKLDDAQHYLDKLTTMFAENEIRSITVAHMEVPCCFGMVRLVESAIGRSGKSIPFKTQMISVKGEEL